MLIGVEKADDVLPASAGGRCDRSNQPRDDKRAAGLESSVSASTGRILL